MNIRLVHLVVGMLLAGPLPAAEGLQAFTKDSLRQIEANRADQPFMLILWSITCGPCREEFEMLSELGKEHGKLPLVLVSTDDAADSAMAIQLLEHYELASAENWIFASTDAQSLRFQIDPLWYGEMPRSYFYDADHTRNAISGGLSRQQVTSWLDEAMARNSPLPSD